MRRSLCRWSSKRLYRLIRIRAEPQEIVVAADEKDGVIRSRAGQHPAEEDKVWLDTARPNWEVRPDTACATLRDTPIVISGSTMVTGFR